MEKHTYHSQVDYLYRVLRKNQPVPCTEAYIRWSVPPVGFGCTDSNVVVPLRGSQPVVSMNPTNRPSAVDRNETVINMARVAFRPGSERSGTSVVVPSTLHVGYSRSGIRRTSVGSPEFPVFAPSEYLRRTVVDPCPHHDHKMVVTLPPAVVGEHIILQRGT